MEQFFSTSGTHLDYKENKNLAATEQHAITRETKF